LLAKLNSLAERCLLLSVVSEPSSSVSEALLLKKKSSSHLLEEVPLVAEVEDPLTPVVELAVLQIAVPVNSSPLAKVLEREAELLATRMISPAFERDQGLRSPLLKTIGVRREPRSFHEVTEYALIRFQGRS